MHSYVFWLYEQCLRPRGLNIMAINNLLALKIPTFCFRYIIYRPDMFYVWENIFVNAYYLIYSKALVSITSQEK